MLSVPTAFFQTHASSFPGDQMAVGQQVCGQHLQVWGGTPGSVFLGGTVARNATWQSESSSTSGILLLVVLGTHRIGDNGVKSYHSGSRIGNPIC